MSNKIYTSIPAPRLPRNTFNRSKPNTLSMTFQRVVPSLLEEIYPGDMFRSNPEVFARLQPMIAPVMNNMKISNHMFYVPLRTVNDHYAEFMFGNRMGDYDQVLPYTHTGFFYLLVDTLATAGKNDVAAEVIRLVDFIGLPFRYSSKTSAALFVSSWLSDAWNMNVAAVNGQPSAADGFRINLCPFWAYQKIVSEYFRDENVEDDPFEVFEQETGEDVFDWTGDVSAGLNTLVASDAEVVASLFMLRRRAWQHDRFTSSLPFAQRGPDVLLPISGTADVTLKDNWVGVTPPGGDAQTGLVAYRASGVDVKRPFAIAASQGTDDVRYNQLRMFTGSTNVAAKSEAAYDPNGSLEIDFAQAGLTTTINDFRTAERVQRFFENDARGGVRPNEGTLSHFGVRTPDASLDRAEFLGGSMQPIVVSEVAQTSESTASSPQGTLAGKGTSYKSNRGFRMFFTEHGFVFNLTSALVRANYWQGIPKVFSRMQRDEYFWPEFASLGEEPVFTKELYADASAVQEDTVFGYVPRYSDLKTAQGEVHGDMRSSLAFWTQTREFANKPELNREFLFADPDLSPFAVQSPYTDPIIVTIQFHIKASRLMPFYGVPTI